MASFTRQRGRLRLCHKPNGGLQMNNLIKFNEWQEMSLKKDVESIVIILKRKKQIEALAFSELGIAFLTIVLDNLNLLKGNPLITGILVVLALTPIGVSIGIVAYRFFKNYRERAGLKHAHNDLVDDFDNKVCYWVMTAVSFYDLLEEKGNMHNRNSLDESIPFLFQETNFYVNKSIEKFHEFEPAAMTIFNNGEGRSKQINNYRLETVIQILYQVRKNSYTYIDSLQTRLSKSANHTIACQKKNDKEYDEVMNNFLAAIQKAGIKVSNVVWN